MKKGRKPTVQTVQEQVRKILSRQYMKSLWRAEVTEENGLPRLDTTFEWEALKELQQTVLGKTIVFTDHSDWTSAQIVSCYRSQWRIEEMFRWSKDRLGGGWSQNLKILLLSLAR